MAYIPIAEARGLTPKLDQQITLNQAAAWRLLFELVTGGQFAVSESTAFKLHHVAAKEEALVWGQFRTGGVLISGTDYTPLPVADQKNGAFYDEWPFA